MASGCKVTAGFRAICGGRRAPGWRKGLESLRNNGLVVPALVAPLGPADAGFGARHRDAIEDATHCRIAYR